MTPREQAKRAQVAAERQLGLVTSALESKDVEPGNWNQHEAYRDAMLLARFTADQVSRLDANNPFTEAVAKSGTDIPQPKMRPLKPSQPQLKTFISIGTFVYGRIKVDWKNGYSFVEVIGTIGDDGVLEKVSDHTDVFLLKSRILDLDERESLGQDDTIAFVAAEGRDGKLAAEEVRAASVEEAEEGTGDVEAEDVSFVGAAVEAESNGMTAALAEWPAADNAAAEASGSGVSPTEEAVCTSEDA